ncbi:MAG: substrate-binding domain-containing protein [Lachnospiraceae bacterium]|nr:substrate-binding domain-containing protein [Lachnospiraceae bacterium]
MRKKLISVMLTAAMTASLLAGCGSEPAQESQPQETTEAAPEQAPAQEEAAQPEEAPADNGELPILGAGIYSSTDNFNSYIAKAITGVSDGVFQVNVDDGQMDQATQLNQIDTALAKGAAAICVSVVDITAAPAIIQKCQDAGNVPIIFFNKEITDKEVVGSYDNLYQVTSTGGDYGAAIQGQMIIDYWEAHPEMDKNGDGKLQMINVMGDPGHTASQPRADYVESTITDAGIEIEVLERDTGMWDTAKAKEKMDAWVSKYGDEIEIVVCANDAMALGVLQSVEAAGFNLEGADSEQYIPIIGIDALPEMLEKIESGEVIGSVLQDASTQGKVIVAIAHNVSQGKDPLDGLDFEFDTDGSKAVRVPYAAITAENVDVAAANYTE